MGAARREGRQGTSSRPNRKRPFAGPCVKRLLGGVWPNGCGQPPRSLRRSSTRGAIQAALDEALAADSTVRKLAEKSVLDIAATLPLDQRRLLADGLHRNGPLRYPQQNVVSPRRVDMALRLANSVGDRIDPRTLGPLLLPAALTPATLDAVGRAENAATGLALAGTRRQCWGPTEFGRTAAANGTGGTDHGTGSAAILRGGQVNGGRVVADWPGLASGALFDGRDLRPAMDINALIAGATAQTFVLDPGRVATTLLSSEGVLQPVEGPLRS